jgi:hypothetical protein
VRTTLIDVIGAAFFIVENRAPNVQGDDPEYLLPEQYLYEILRYQEEIINWSVEGLDNDLFIELIKFTQDYEQKFSQNQAISEEEKTEYIHWNKEAKALE